MQLALAISLLTTKHLWVLAVDKSGSSGLQKTSQISRGCQRTHRHCTASHWGQEPVTWVPKPLQLHLLTY